MPYVTGFPRIGEKRELKFALEKYWNKEITLNELQEVAKTLRKRHWKYQKEAGIEFIGSNDFSFYDQMIDTIVMVGAEPEEYNDLDGLDRYFAMARGDKTHKALAMTKWFNTNYHYFVPILHKDQNFSLNLDKVISEYQEAKALGIETEVNLIGPVTFLALSRTSDGSNPLDLLDRLLPIYQEALNRLEKIGAKNVQLDEPALVRDPDEKLLNALQKSYETLKADDLELFVVTYFEHANEAVEILVDTSVDGIGLDFVHGPKNIESVEKIAKSGKKLIAGVVDGRNIWVSDIEKKVEFLNALPIDKDRLVVSTSCSLLHVPYTLEYEEKLDSNIKTWLAFAKEKLNELRIIDKLYRSKELGEDEALLEANKKANATRKSSTQIHNKSVQDRLANLTKEECERSLPATRRLELQHEILKYPILPTTTIGSFPQTKEVRAIRKAYKDGVMSEEEYKEKIKEQIRYCVKVQEDIGLDVLVHGEFERNDMVEYFGEFLEGVTFSQNGWVQSYGSRCVKPPIIFGDVSRPEPMTVEWITYAQSLTDKPMKGMLTGPVTMLNWSFVRDDLKRESVYKQMALAIADEVKDLQEAGIQIIQVDEAAFKEGYPLRDENKNEYERVAVESFKIATAVAKPETQIHTHMCYSDFNDIMPTIDAMDADVISIETARNGNRLLEAFKNYNYQKEVGAGVYDIHSPRVPSKEELIKEIEKKIQVFPASKLWINPDCGLKTRKWDEVIPALTNMVEATKEIRKRIVKL
ncbi:5-methyltetrahydropteroyltriglutamate--homocysteine S-methyltransferase [Nitratiruptor tergarcus]|uniref:5-methyltetrahydropteroyltriglutamate--homocysteine methyltransferase n=1 Tax=Nitratiruptor tergarcus DSM 16512 TaxID=1069081 RepID=A0A1W1WTT5_9BACT|nr:5-methyltetrahydropteroyltriglutamate--homocysteine S-methyltransferase [Nitratiruptor tergarcus]SMC09728.1 methionine synthase (B12-independent) [Nitratiruptor tergarcus DSM 16512]